MWSCCFLSQWSQHLGGLSSSSASASRRCFCKAVRQGPVPALSTRNIIPQQSPLDCVCTVIWKRIPRTMLGVSVSSSHPGDGEPISEWWSKHCAVFKKQGVIAHGQEGFALGPRLKQASSWASGDWPGSVSEIVAEFKWQDGYLRPDKKLGLELTRFIHWHYKHILKCCCSTNNTS